MERQTLVFITERETKNTVRFQGRGKRQATGYRHAVCAALGARRTLATAADRDN